MTKLEENYLDGWLGRLIGGGDMHVLCIIIIEAADVMEKGQNGEDEMNLDRWWRPCHSGSSMKVNLLKAVRWETNSFN